MLRTAYAMCNHLPCHHTTSMATVGGIKLVTVPFRTVPSKQNMFRAIHRSIPVSHAQATMQLTRWACLTDMSRTRVCLWTRIDALHCQSSKLCWDTLCCCRSLASSVFFDRRLTVSGFCYCQSIDLGLLIDSNRFYN